MKHWLLLSCLCLFAETARADGMDLALSRLRIPAGAAGCQQTSGLCADDEAFERLVSQLAITAAPPVTTGAHTVGPAGFSATLVHSTTTIAADSLYWQRGTVGDQSATEQDLNSSPSTALTWSRLEVRKGLPMGFELAADVGHGFGTSMWAVGGRLKLAIFEGFHSGLGQLPDLSLEATTQAVTGARDLSLLIHGVHLTLSKSYVVFERLRLTPLVAAQLLYVVADSGAVDLASGLTPAGCDGNAQACDQSLTNIARFPSLRQLRVRWVVGVELGGGVIRGFATAAMEAPTETLTAAGRAYGGARVPTQLAISAGFGAQF